MYSMKRKFNIDCKMGKQKLVADGGFVWFSTCLLNTVVAIQIYLQQKTKVKKLQGFL